tara:strand:+ start:1584 stop:1820 length:237 start_codon:yes stop_codon:yes gene_type:complete
MEEIKYKTKEELKEADTKIVWLLNPFIYPDTSKRVNFEMKDKDGKSQSFSPTISGLIGFINGVIHHLEHHEEKINIKG